MNSFYGVLGTPTSRFYEPAVAGAITGFGRHVLLWSKAWLEVRGRRVLYGDTDSLFAVSGEEEPEAAEALGTRLAAELNDALAAHLRERWRVESRLELRFDGLFLRLLFPEVRGGGAGARKRYAGLVSGDELVFRGMETVRSDWTPLARELQRELYARLFRDQPVADWLRTTVAGLREGCFDARLVYRKRLRKPAEDYTATTPPHVAAARKLGRGRRGRIEYVMTSAGPEPSSRQQHPLDREHYVQKQVRPVVEPVLRLLGLDFDQVVGDEVQLSLF
jgi:DNA polymerase-2